MAKYCRSDKCQSSIVTDLRRVGACVLVVSQFHLGFDIIVGMYGKIGLFELKNSDKEKLTENEAVFFSLWHGYVYRAKSTNEICTIMAHDLAGDRF